MMNPRQQFDETVNFFVAQFNRMCAETYRNYLLRTKNTKNESSTNPERVKVVYKVRPTNHGWEIFAESRTFFFFTKEYPLLDIFLSDSGKITFSGLFITQTPVIKQTPQDLHFALQNYLSYCRNSSQNAFVNV